MHFSCSLIESREVFKEQLILYLSRSLCCCAGQRQHCGLWGVDLGVEVR